MASSNGGFQNTNKRAKKHKAFIKKTNRQRNLRQVTEKRNMTNAR